MKPADDEPRGLILPADPDPGDPFTVEELCRVLLDPPALPGEVGNDRKRGDSAHG